MSNQGKLTVRLKEEKKTNMKTTTINATKKEGPSLLPSDENLMRIKGRYFGGRKLEDDDGQERQETWMGYTGASE